MPIEQGFAEVSVNVRAIGARASCATSCANGLSALTLPPGQFLVGRGGWIRPAFPKVQLPSKLPTNPSSEFDDTYIRSTKRVTPNPRAEAIYAAASRIAGATGHT